jgi:hypothetical protein
VISSRVATPQCTAATHIHPAGFFCAGFGFTFGIGFAAQTRFNASLKGIAG